MFWVEAFLGQTFCSTPDQQRSISLVANESSLSKDVPRRAKMCFCSLLDTSQGQIHTSVLKTWCNAQLPF